MWFRKKVAICFNLKARWLDLWKVHFSSCFPFLQSSASTSALFLGGGKIEEKVMAELGIKKWRHGKGCVKDMQQKKCWRTFWIWEIKLYTYCFKAISSVKRTFSPSDQHVRQNSYAPGVRSKRCIGTFYHFWGKKFHCAK